MDEQQQRRMNEAAEQFSDALVNSFRAVSQRSEAAQERAAQLTGDFFTRVINNLHTQAESNREVFYEREEDGEGCE